MVKIKMRDSILSRHLYLLHRNGLNLINNYKSFQNLELKPFALKSFFSVFGVVEKDQISQMATNTPTGPAL